MKKIVKLFIIFIGIIIISGCDKAIGEKVDECTLVNDQSKYSNYTIVSTYKIYSKKDIVTRVSTEEKLTSKNTTVIKYFDNLLRKQYKSLNDTYGGYNFDVQTKDDSVISKVNINYNKMNLKKYIESNPQLKSYINKDNKFTVKGIKSMYSSLGAECK